MFARCATVARPAIYIYYYFYFTGVIKEVSYTKIFLIKILWYLHKMFMKYPQKRFIKFGFKKCGTKSLSRMLNRFYGLIPNDAFSSSSDHKFSISWSISDVFRKNVITKKFEIKKNNLVEILDHFIQPWRFNLENFRILRKLY